MAFNASGWREHPVLPGTPPDIWGLSWAQDPFSWRLIEGKWVAVWRLELHTQLDETAAIHTIELAQPVPTQTTFMKSSRL